MTYLDNASTSFPKPPQVVEAVARFLGESGGSPGRGGHRFARAGQQVVDETRTLLNNLFNGRGPENFAFVLNDTDALNIAIKGTLSDGDHVITTVLEHNSVLRPLWALQKAGVISVTFVDCSDEGLVDPDDIARAFTPATRLVVMIHASNVLGTIQPIKEVGRIARERGAIFLVDAAQTAGALTIDVREMNIDLLAFPGHKGLMGPTGTGGLYVEPGTKIRPFRHGGTGVLSESFDQPAEMPYLLEAGSANTAGIVGLAAALKFIEKTGLATIRSKERHLTKALLAGLSEQPGLTVYGPKSADARAAPVAFNINGRPSEDLAEILDSDFDIASRPGLHCAPRLHKRLGTFPDGAARLSPGFFNTPEDIEAAICAIKKIISKAAV